MNKTIYFFVLEKAEKVDRMMEEITHAPWADRIRIHVDERHVPEGYRCIRIFPAEATKERMLARLAGDGRREGDGDLRKLPGQV